MAISEAQIKYGPAGSGGTYASGAMRNVFGQGVEDGPTDYRLVEVRNTSSLTMTGVTAHLVIDPRGAAVAIAVADGIARDSGYTYSVDPTSLTYSTPTTAGSGLALPDLGPSQKCLVAIRRTLSGASPAAQDNNGLRITGSSPA